MPQQAHCTSCLGEFTPRRDQVGGIVNCPLCGVATPVEGLRDPLWRLLQVGLLVLALVVGGTIGAVAGPAAGVLAGLGGLGVCWLLTRAL